MNKKSTQNSFTMQQFKKKALGFVFFLIVSSMNAQFVHPGITNKISDLDRVKYMVEAQVEPWFSSYKEMTSDSKASYNYNVRGNQSFTELGRDDGTNYNAWNDDIRAAYYNAIQWYVTGDTKHAEKSIEIFNAWKNLQDVTSGGTQALSGSIVYIMLEAAEIIKSTYTGWSANDIQDFKDMLVYPGYSTTAEPSGISRVSGSFYWQAYQGDPVRHGNQGLSAFRAVMAMGIFMDNEIMYERALRYLQGLPHRSDDLPYPAGPPTATSISKTGDYEDTYNYTVGNSIEDFGYNEVITNYIYANGQCQESSRDQQHTFFGIGTICAMAEMAWNQGDDLYSHADDRLLLGLEYSSKYNVSYLQSYPDQTTHWVPTVDSGEFTQRFNASQRVYAKFISPTHVGGYVGNRPMLEMPLGHYYGRGFKTMEEVKWTSRARDIAIDKTGYEDAGHQNGSIGWGALTSRRADGCYGDPISGFDSNNSLPQFSMNVLGGVIEAENFDYFMVNGQDHVYNDISSSNSGGAYRTDENVDIKTCSEGGFNLTDIESGEWLTYTVYVPDNGTYDLSIRYAANNGDGKIKFNVGGTDITSDVAVPYGAPNSTGLEDWKDFTVASSVTLSKGIQPLKIFFSGADAAFELNNFNVSLVEATAGPINYALEGAATQSSTFFGGEASRAIDDNISGLWDSGSITFTNSELNAWWQVALTKEINVGAINIFNWKGFESRLSDFTVSVIDANGATTFSKVITTVQDETFTVNAGGALGEIVKVQLNNTNFLSLAEVQVFADPTSLSVSDEFINLNLYPNPVSKILNVSLNDLGFELNNTKIVLHSISGKKVFEQKMFSEKVQMNLEDLATGIYIITINDNHKTISKKILKK